MDTGQFLIYGSTGYTGQLVAQAAVRSGLRPILAGRNVEKVGQQAASLGLEWRTFRLGDSRALDRALGDTGLVLLLAGPYIHTSKRVVEACLRTGAHYLDITGEIDVYEMLAKYDVQAQSKGIMIGTGMGFDVTPTDCLALYLKNGLPSATELRLAFTARGRSHYSHGTLLSGLDQLPQGLRVRRKGKLVHTEFGEKSLVVDFGWGPLTCSLFNWGDVVTAFWSTDIPNIEVYTPTNPSLERLITLADGARRVLGWKITRSLARRAISFLPNGANPAQRAATQMVVWGQVSDLDGKRLSARLYTPEAYELTAASTVQAVIRLLNGGVRSGFQTPASAFGPDFVLELPGVTREDISVE
jgi:short subunit dehydrogenase-like uncharacterized protein